ncbi:MAG: biotin/lipoyl-binding protein, partial [Desulfovibrio sp.]|nr:biotin/lipoyl-binding protein [Desulfovibrio sp.]
MQFLSRPRRPWAFSLAARCAAFLAACSGGGDAAKGPPPAPVHVRPVSAADVPRVLSAVGNVRASATVGVTPRVTGELLEVRFTEGQEVEAGEPLVVIDPRP